MLVANDNSSSFESSVCYFSPNISRSDFRRKEKQEEIAKNKEKVEKESKFQLFSSELSEEDAAEIARSFAALDLASSPKNKEKKNIFQNFLSKLLTFSHSASSVSSSEGNSFVCSLQNTFDDSYNRCYKHNNEETYVDECANNNFLSNFQNHSFCSSIFPSVKTMNNNCDKNLNTMYTRDEQAQAKKDKLKESEFFSSGFFDKFSFRKPCYAPPSKGSSSANLSKISDYSSKLNMDDECTYSENNERMRGRVNANNRISASSYVSSPFSSFSSSGPNYRGISSNSKMQISDYKCAEDNRNLMRLFSKNPMNKIFGKNEISDVGEDYEEQGDDLLYEGAANHGGKSKNNFSPLNKNRIESSMNNSNMQNKCISAKYLYGDAQTQDKGVNNNAHNSQIIRKRMKSDKLLNSCKHMCPSNTNRGIICCNDVDDNDNKAEILKTDNFDFHKELSSRFNYNYVNLYNKQTYAEIILENAHKWIRVILNLFLVTAILYTLWSAFFAVKNDIESKVQIHNKKIQAEISQCLKQYRENNCYSTERLPYLEQPCADWEKCMSMDPKINGELSHLSAKILGEILNAFFEQLEWRTIVIICVAFVIILVGSNFALSVDFSRRSASMSNHSSNSLFPNAAPLAFPNSAMASSFNPTPITYEYHLYGEPSRRMRMKESQMMSSAHEANDMHTIHPHNFSNAFPSCYHWCDTNLFRKHK